MLRVVDVNVDVVVVPHGSSFFGRAVANVVADDAAAFRFGYAVGNMKDVPIVVPPDPPLRPDDPPVAADAAADDKPPPPPPPLLPIREIRSSPKSTSLHQQRLAAMASST